MSKGKRKFAFMLLLVASLISASPALPAAERGGGSLDTLKQYVADLKKTPENVDLREKVIKYALSLKQKPPVPEDYERQMVRGNAFLKIADNEEGYKKAADEYQLAMLAAPWMAEGYLSLSTAQEKAGLYAEAVQSLNFALLADPNAKNARELRNHVYELEVYAEDAKQALKTSPNVPVIPPPPPTPVKIAPPAAKKQQAAPEKKTNPKAFVGAWFYKDMAPRGGEEVTTQSFTISMGSDGRLVAQAPRRSTGAIGTVTKFELDNDSIHIQVTWKLATIPSYWKTEDYELTLTSDESKLKGSYRIKSSGKGEFAEEKIFFKQ